MIAKLFEARETQNKGKGFFAKDFIPKGTIICFECNKCKIVSACLGVRRICRKLN